MSAHRHPRAILGLLALLAGNIWQGLAVFSVANGQVTSTWNATGGGAWELDANWLNGAPTDPGDVAVFAGTRPSSSAVISISSQVQLGGLIDASSRSITLQGIEPLTFDDPQGAPLITVTNGTGRLSLQVPLSVAAGDTLTVRVAAGGSLVSEGVIAAGGAIVKEDPGLWEIRNDNHTWTGPLEIEAGVVRVASSRALGGGITSQANATTVHAAGVLQLNSNLTDEFVQLDSGRLQGGGAQSFAGTLQLTDDSFLSSNSSAQSLSVLGTITGPAGLTVDAGSVILASANTYEGLTRVTSGTLIIDHPQALGDTRVGTQVSGGRLRIQQPTTEPIELTAGEVDVQVASTGVIRGRGGTVNYGAATASHNVSLEGATLAIGSPVVIHDVLASSSTGGEILLVRQNNFNNGGTNRIDMGALPQGGTGFRLGSDEVSTVAATTVLLPISTDRTIAVGAGTGELRLPMVIADPAGMGPLQIDQDGRGTTVLSGANTYSGHTWIRRGVLEIDHRSALGSASGSVADGTTVLTGGELRVDNVATVSGELLRMEGGTLSFSSRTLNRRWEAPLEIVTRGRIQGTSTTTIAGPITGQGELQLNHDNLRLEGEHEFQGTIVIEAGQVTTQSSGALGSATGATEVRSGGKLILNHATSEPLVLAGGEIQVTAASASYIGAIRARGGLVQLPPNVPFTGSLALESGQSHLRGIGVFAGGTSGEGTLAINTSTLTINGQPLTHAGDVIVQNSLITFANANTYTGDTHLRNVQATVNHPQALGSPAAPTFVEEGSRLLLAVSTDEPIEIQSGGELDLASHVGSISAQLRLNGGELRLNGAELRGNVELLAADAFQAPLLRGGKWSATFTGEGGFVVSHDDPVPAQFRGDSSYRGPTYVSVGAVDVLHANALGSPDTGTQIEQGSLILSVRTEEPILMAHSGSIAYQTSQSTLPTFYDDPFRFDRDLGFGTLLLNSRAEYAETAELFETRLEVNDATTIDGLVLHGQRSHLKVADGRALTVRAPQIDIAAGHLEGRIRGPQTIRKHSVARAELTGLRDFDGEIQVDRGRLEIHDSTALGSTAGATVITGPQAALWLVGEARISEDIFLRNHHGVDGISGALYLGNSSRVDLDGTLDLGEIGATIGGDAINTLNLNGPVVGGNLEMRGGTIWITGPNARHTGRTEIHEGIFVLGPDAVLESTERIVLHPRATMYLSQDSPGPQQQIGDNIPLDSLGGTISVSSAVEGTVESVGPMTLRQGHTTLDNYGAGNELRIKSLTQQSGATLSLSIGEQARVTLDERPVLQHGLLGGWAVTYSGFAFATVDASGAVQHATMSTTQLNTATLADTVLIEEPTTLQSSRTIHALNATAPLDLGGNTLTIQSGGLISNGVFNGRVTAGAGEAAELYLFGGAGLAADIVDNETGSVSLVVSGPYAQAISGNNTYSGATIINPGHVTVSSGSLPAGTELILNGGHLTLAAQETFLVDELIVRDGARLDGFGLLQSSRTILEDGSIEVPLTGSGPVSKSTRGRAGITNLEAFTGQVLVNEGLLVVGGPPTSAQFVLNGGTLRTTFEERVVVPAEIKLQQGVWQTGAGHFTTPIVVEGPTQIVAQGAIVEHLTGSGDVWIDAEDRRSVLTLRNAESYTGDLRVERGTLRLEGDALNNLRRMTFASDGILELIETELSAPAIFEGGSILVRGSVTVDSTLDVRTKARIERDGFASNLVVTGEMRLADQSLVESFGHEATSVIVEGPITLNGASTWSNQWGDALLRGPITARHAASKLQLTGPSRAAIELDASYVIPQQMSLQIERGIDPETLLISGNGRFVRGGGRLLNSMSLDQQAALEPGDAVGTLTVQGDVELKSGAIWNWQLNALGGSAGIDWDLLNVDGTLSLAGDAQAPITLAVLPVNQAGQPAALAGFNAHDEYLWTVARFSESGSLNLQDVNIDSSSFAQWHTVPTGYGFWMEALAGELQLHYGPIILPGDFDGDFQFDVDDIDRLSDAVRHGETDLRFDLDQDGRVTSGDRVVWVESLKHTYFGDANLDGQFSSSDLVAVFVAGTYEDSIVGNSSWASGDWNGDGDFTTSDLVLAFQSGGYEQGPRLAALIPEPAGATLTLAGLVTLLARRRIAASAVSKSLAARRGKEI